MAQEHRHLLRLRIQQATEIILDVVEELTLPVLGTEFPQTNCLPVAKSGREVRRGGERGSNDEVTGVLRFRQFLYVATPCRVSGELIVGEDKHGRVLGCAKWDWRRHPCRVVRTPEPDGDPEPATSGNVGIGTQLAEDSTREIGRHSRLRMPHHVHDEHLTVVVRRFDHCFSFGLHDVQRYSPGSRSTSRRRPVTAVLCFSFTGPGQLVLLDRATRAFARGMAERFRFRHRLRRQTTRIRVFPTLLGVAPKEARGPVPTLRATGPPAPTCVAVAARPDQARAGARGRR